MLPHIDIPGVVKQRPWQMTNNFMAFFKNLMG